MFVFVFGVIGALIGAYIARRRKGRGLDIAQYAAGYGIAFCILGLFVNLIVLRMM